jgi:hypothetical protein
MREGTGDTTDDLSVMSLICFQQDYCPLAEEFDLGIC